MRINTRRCLRMGGMLCKFMTSVIGDNLSHHKVSINYLDIISHTKLRQLPTLTHPNQNLKLAQSALIINLNHSNLLSLMTHMRTIFYAEFNEFNYKLTVLLIPSNLMVILIATDYNMCVKIITADFTLGHLLCSSKYSTEHVKRVFVIDTYE